MRWSHPRPRPRWPSAIEPSNGYHFEDDNWPVDNEELFRVGPGYIEMWIHEPRAHWELNPREQVALRELEESFARLIKQRDSVQNARRRFLPASSLSTRVRATPGIQQDLFDATHDYFQTFYSTLSALASFLSRFSTELESNVPHRSNAKFLEWLKPLALFRDQAIPVLQEARRFRALLDHKASHQPADWGTIDFDGFVRIVLHGPSNSAGSIPDGAMAKLSGLDMLPEDHDWQFIAPDEDIVLWALAVQMNATFPRIQPWRWDAHRADTCRWELILGEGDEKPYSIFAHVAGKIVYAGPANEAPQIPRKTKPTRPLRPDEISGVLSRYFEDKG